jgi:hypothetical protein
MSNETEIIQDFSKSMEDLKQKEALLVAEKQILMKKGLESSDPLTLLKANEVVAASQVQNRETSDRKSMLIDPSFIMSSFGYKDKTFGLSYATLWRMAKTNIPNAIIRTRINQVAAFCEPQSDKYTTGFVIRKKKLYGRSDAEEKLTTFEQKEIEAITEFVLNCGKNDGYQGEDFDSFTRKVIQDSLTWDQMTWEIVSDRRGYPFEFVPTDASTFRLSESFDDDAYKQDLLRRRNLGQQKKIKGYYPSFVQLNKQNEVASEFYPWELCFGIRNPSTSTFNFGYGRGELEDLITTITSMLWGEDYNRRFFSQGSIPKGFFKLKSGVGNQTMLNDFKQQFMGMMTGVQNAWKTPVIEGDFDWINLHNNNNDMEFSRWYEFLIKISCAIFCIDPAEINFPLGGSSDGGNPMFEGNKTDRLKFSKDKGLYPLLRFYQRRLNQSVIKRLNPKYELAFVGMDGLTIQDELEMDLKKGNSFVKLNELRSKWGYKEDEFGNVIGMGAYMTMLNNAQMEKQNQEQQQAQNQEGADQSGQQEEENPFMKSIINEYK